MMLVDVLRFCHIIGAMILFGTGVGIAFFMLAAHLTRDARFIAHVAGTVVVADAIFTATAVVSQPVTGYLLARTIGWPLSTGWLASSLALYVVTCAFWFPVVAIQLRLRGFARQAAATGSPLPPAYFKLFRIWFACGVPAFFAVIAIIWLMTTRPDFKLPSLG
jgi:uncharacterized membrane protein